MVDAEPLGEPSALVSETIFSYPALMVLACA